MKREGTRFAWVRSMFEVQVGARSMSPFVEILGTSRVAAITQIAASMRELLGSHAVWNVNSTATGGGVAEMLYSLLRYARGLGVDVRWAVLEADAGFFRITKRLHNALHDDKGDASPLGRDQQLVFDRVTDVNYELLARLVRPGDVVICHDPQTAGLVAKLVRSGARVVWRCHIGHDRAGQHVDAGWAFLRPYLEAVPLAVFSREAYAPAWMPRKRTVVLPPSVDPFSVKNQWMSDDDVRAVLAAAGLIERDGAKDAVFVRNDDTPGRITHTAEVLRSGALPSWETPLVLQVGRWDRMKDPLGVLQAFVRLAERNETAGAALVLAGPMVLGVADDPEAPEEFQVVERAWRALPAELRARIYLAQLPMADTDENAAIVNALQRHAVLVLQKSLREGFGLTVTEAMWKGRPVVASAIGGIPDQLRDGVDGLLVRDPTNVEECADAMRRILNDPALAKRFGQSGYERARDEFLSIASLERWAELVRVLVSGGV